VDLDSRLFYERVKMIYVYFWIYQFVIEHYKSPF